MSHAAQCDPQEMAEMRRDMGSTAHPLQYAIWIGPGLQGDFGRSIQFRERLRPDPASLPTTSSSSWWGSSSASCSASPADFSWFAWRGTVKGTARDVGSIVVLSIPEFLWAILLILGLGVGVRLLPFIGRLDAEISVPRTTGFILLDTCWPAMARPSAARSSIWRCPAVSLALALTPMIMRVLRSSLFDTYADDYITPDRLRGLSEPRICWAMR
jgi:peptide/nickel transport system permease protein